MAAAEEEMNMVQRLGGAGGAPLAIEPGGAGREEREVLLLLFAPRPLEPRRVVLSIT